MTLDDRPLPRTTTSAGPLLGFFDSPTMTMSDHSFSSSEHQQRETRRRYFFKIGQLIDDTIVPIKVSISEAEEEGGKEEKGKETEMGGEAANSMPDSTSKFHGSTTESSSIRHSLTSSDVTERPCILGWTYCRNLDELKSSGNDADTLLPPTFLQIPSDFATFNISIPIATTTKAVESHKLCLADSVLSPSFASSQCLSVPSDVKKSPVESLRSQTSDASFSPIRRKKITCVVSTDEDFPVHDLPTIDEPIFHSHCVSLESSSFQGDRWSLPSIQRKVGRWTKEEDAALVEAVANERSSSRINWKEISTRSFGGTRNAAQCKSRWNKALCPTIKRGPFTPEEDEIIVLARRKGMRYNDISRICLPGRTTDQIRFRDQNVLDPNRKALKDIPWSAAEKQVLIDAQRVMGNKWTTIAKLLPGRTENDVKNQWYNAKDSSRRAWVRLASVPDNPSSSAEAATRSV